MLKLNLKRDLAFISLQQRRISSAPPLRKSFSTTKPQISYYDILGVRTNATQADIKQAYYDKVKLFHPDQSKVPEAEEKFKTLVKAYETLKDPISRQNYDIERNRPYSGSSSTHSGYSSYTSYYASNMQTDAVQYEYRPAYDEEPRKNDYAGQRSQPIWNEFLTSSFFMKMCLGIGAAVLFDMWWNPKKKVKKVIDAEDQTLAVGSLVFESPLVFVRDKPIDPVKLQEEIKKKQFRIEYKDSPPKNNSATSTAREKKKWKEPKVDKRIAELDEFIVNRAEKLQKKDIVAA